MQRPAKAPGEDRNRVTGPASPARWAQRPAKAPGEDRNWVPGPALAARASSARPKRRARIATASTDRHVPSPRRQRPAKAPGEDRNLRRRATLDDERQQRPAKAPGEDRNTSIAHRGRKPPSSARPKRRARIATLLAGSRPWAPRRQRPAKAPGEDRNSQSKVGDGPIRGSSARPKRRARIATSVSHRRLRPGRRCSARPKRRARIATPSRATRSPSSGAAPGQSAGRGSQLADFAVTDGAVGRSARPKRRARIATS